MKLQFIKNAPQRVANSRPLPLKQVEAIILYGKPEQRAKVVDKILPSAYGLALNQTTHYLLLSVIEKCESVDRVKLLYSIRRKILDLSISPVGNKIIQKLLELVPKRQRVEMAECYVLNAEEDEFKKLCMHSFGNHVAQKMMEYKECVEVLESALLKDLPLLCSHEYGMRVVDSYIQNTKDGWKNVVEAVLRVDSEKLVTDVEDGEEEEGVLDEATSKQLDEGLYKLFQKTSESMVICSLLRYPLTPLALKDAICAHLSAMVPDYLTPEQTALESKKNDEERKRAVKGNPSEKEDSFALPDFGTGTGHSKKRLAARGNGHGEEGDATYTPRHVHTFREMLEYGTVTHRRLLWSSFSSTGEGRDTSSEDGAPPSSVIQQLIKDKRVVSVAVFAVRFYETCRKVFLNAMLQTVSSSSASPATEEKTIKAPQGVGKVTRTLNEVAQDPVATLVLRAIIEEDSSLLTEKQRSDLVAKDAVRTLAKNPVSSPVLQRLINADTSGVTAEKVLRALQGELPEMVLDGSATYVVQCSLLRVDPTRKAEWSKCVLRALGNLKDTLSYAQGSHVLQKVVSCMDDNGVRAVVKQLIKLAQSGEQGEGVEVDKNSVSTSAPQKKRCPTVEKDEEERSEEEEKKKKKPAKLTTKEQQEINRKKHYSVVSDAILSYATHAHACYVIQALLMETRNRQMDAERRLLMNELKPYVFELAISPWSGRVVLDAMLLAGTAELKASIKNVVFLKAEAWLTEGGTSGKGKQGSGGSSGSVDPTIRHILKRQREASKEGRTEKKSSENNSEESRAPSTKRKKLYRTLKK